MKPISRILAVAAAAVALLAPYNSVLAHGGGSVSVAPGSVSSGGDVKVTLKTSGGSTTKIELRGVLNTYPLGEMKADTAGNASQSFKLPSQAKPGQYTVIAIAADGDVIARADLSIVAESHAAMSGMESSGMKGGMMMASAELMPVPVSRTTAGLAAILLIVVASLAGGFFLLRRTSDWTRE